MGRKTQFPPDRKRYTGGAGYPGEDTDMISKLDRVSYPWVPLVRRVSSSEGITVPLSSVSTYGLEIWNVYRGVLLLRRITSRDQGASSSRPGHLSVVSF